jgi:hypothetical protein
MARGAAESIRKRAGTPFPPRERVDVDRATDAAVSALGWEVFTGGARAGPANEHRGGGPLTRSLGHSPVTSGAAKRSITFTRPSRHPHQPFR